MLDIHFACRDIMAVKTASQEEEDDGDDEDEDEEEDEQAHINPDGIALEDLRHYTA